MFVYVTLQQLPETKQLKSQVRCGEMGNRMVKRHMVNDHNSFAAIIQQTRSKKLDTRQTCDVHEGKNFFKKNRKSCVCENVVLQSKPEATNPGQKELRMFCQHLILFETNL